MPADSTRSPADRHADMVRAAFGAALRGDLEAVREILADDVRWYQAGYEGSGCQTRQEAMVWIGETIARGVTAEVLDVRPLDANRVLVLLQRNLRRDDETIGTPPAPHGQIVTFRGDQVAEIVVYSSDSDALDAAGRTSAAV